MTTWKEAQTVSIAVPEMSHSELWTQAEPELRSHRRWNRHSRKIQPEEVDAAMLSWLAGHTVYDPPLHHLSPRGRDIIQSRLAETITARYPDLAVPARTMGLYGIYHCPQPHGDWER